MDTRGPTSDLVVFEVFLGLLYLLIPKSIIAENTETEEKGSTDRYIRSKYIIDR